MKFKEFFRGTPEEIATQKTVKRLRNKSNLSPKEKSCLQKSTGMTRRVFLRRAGTVLAGGATFLVAGGTLLKLLEAVEDQEGEDGKYALGERIRNWRLPDGTSMLTIIPELDKAGSVFQRESLDDLMPTAAQPVTVRYLDHGVGELKLHPKFSEDKTIKVINEGVGIEPFDMPLLTSLKPEILLLKSMKGTAAELAVAAKEAMQVADFNEYCRFFRVVLEGRGSKFTLVKPNAVNVSEELVNASIAIFQSNLQKEKDGFSWFEQLVDSGAHIRMGGIAYANWRVNYPHENSRVSKDFIAGGENAAGLLQHEGIIVQTGRTTFKYARRSAPQIGTLEFQDLFSKASGLAPR